MTKMTANETKRFHTAIGAKWRELNTRIEQDGDAVVIHTDLEALDGARFAVFGGYVRRLNDAGSWDQVVEGFRRTGATMMATPATLPTAISDAYRTLLGRIVGETFWYDADLREIERYVRG